MELPLVHQPNFFQRTVYFCAQKLHELVKVITACGLRIFQTIFCCFLPKNERNTLSVTEISSRDIQSLGEKITLHVMERLNMGTSRAAPIPTDSILQKMKPHVVNLLQAVFANGDEFMQGGFEFVIRGRMHHPQYPKGGLLPADVSVQRILNAMELNDLDWRITLGINRDETESLRRPCFDMRDWYNGGQVGHSVLRA